MVQAIGIDVAEPRKGLDIVALDGGRQIVERRARATLDDVRAMVESLRPEVVCIDSPPAWSNDGNSRAAERGLRAIGITAFLTPTDPGDHAFYRWMRAGFAIFDAVAADYPRYRTGPVNGTALEVFPEATAVVLAGERRSTTESKVVFRRRVLTAHGVDAAALPNLDAVDAALAALTGVLALDGQFVGVGDPDEGVIVLPVAALPDTRFGAATATAADAGPGRAARSSVSRSSPPTGQILCGCGCGVLVARRFLPGHDAKLKGRLLREHHAGDADATAKLQALGWLPDA